MAHVDTSITYIELALMVRLAVAEKEITDLMLQLEWASQNLNETAYEECEQISEKVYTKLPQEPKQNA